MKAAFIVLGSVFGGLAAIALIVGLWLSGTYNGLNTQRNEIDGAWARVESAYQRRVDLIPNLANTAERFLTQEKDIVREIAQARTRYAGATTTDQRVESINQMESALARLLVIVENYPNLKSDATMLRMMDELAGTENRINQERNTFNGKVQGYNTKLTSFPTMFVAGMFGFEKRAYFEADKGAEKAPKVFPQASPAGSK